MLYDTNRDSSSEVCNLRRYISLSYPIHYYYLYIGNIKSDLCPIHRHDLIFEKSQLYEDIILNIYYSNLIRVKTLVP